MYRLPGRGRHWSAPAAGPDATATASTAAPATTQPPRTLVRTAMVRFPPRVSVTCPQPEAPPPRNPDHPPANDQKTHRG
ncbi:hypothetical protein GCM10010215_59000 [Streptomyces virginiae]|uniref:Uncharacterized protein n=1 Tax=Streptomyces virginiae TaxID=1961 RepID=A0ABQ3NTW3_STRVG|nr:hypothetical protein GCM10010215_59000 [Streptomyces virginiae]GHI14942.1 hypothetical protein Scinn_44050 [Streptomyces virginiae]GHI16201.1 hypothetical protein Scinn_56640 [Streptomyces virginiae]